MGLLQKEYKKNLRNLIFLINKNNSNYSGKYIKKDKN